MDRFHCLLTAAKAMAGKSKSLTQAQKEALLKEAATLKRLADIYAILREAEGELDGMVELSSEETIPTSPRADAVANTLATLPLADAVVEHLRIVRRPQTAQQIWMALERSGREVLAENPTNAVVCALRKVQPKSNDLVKVGFGTWTLRSVHTKAELDVILLKGAGRGGRTRTEHSKRTREGMKRFVAAGGKVGQKLKLTPELRDRALTLLAMPGAKTRHVAKQLGVSTSLLNNSGITKASARAAKGDVTESAVTDDPNKVVRLVAGGSGKMPWEKVE